MPLLDPDDIERATLAAADAGRSWRDRFPVSASVRCWLGIILATLLMAAIPSFVAAQALSGCEFGQAVTDRHGVSGVIIGEHNELCLIKYKDGQTQGWVSAKSLAVAPPSNPAATVTSPEPPAIAGPAAPDGVTTLRPTIVNRLVYRADALGHIVITAKVNGAPVQFLVDTGATLVSLTPQDASDAGLKRSELTFDQTIHTGNGPVRAAYAQLREIRIEQLEIDHVPAAVVDSLKQSVLGMSFLSRLKGFVVRDGALTINW